ncbi:hypothetical protein CR513_12668, partial [Mucuna pruriens]
RIFGAKRRAWSHGNGFSDLQEDDSPWETGNVWSNLSLYLFTLHIPFSFGGLSVVALFYGQSVLHPQTQALSLLTIQILELSGALVLLKYTAKPQYKFSNFFKKNKLLSNRNWFLSSTLGFGFLILLIFLTSLLADRLFGSKDLSFLKEHGLLCKTQGVILHQVYLILWHLKGVNNPILKEMLLNSDISRVSCVLAYCFVTPLLEEVVYRGFLLTSLASTMEWQQAVAISSVIFSAIHFSAPYRNLTNWPNITLNPTQHKFFLSPRVLSMAGFEQQMKDRAKELKVFFKKGMKIVGDSCKKGWN